MELVTDVVNNQLYLYLPVAFVLVGAILVFTFGFKSAEQPHFDKLSTIIEDKRAASKKRKSKDKKVAVNGSAVAVTESKPTKEKQSPNKEAPTTPKQTKSKEPEKKKEIPKKNKPNTLEDQNNKKNIKTKSSDKPVDFDDGNWEKVPTKNDKKTKKQDSPAKQPKKSKKTDGENVTKDDVNQQNKDENKENLQKIAEEIITKEIVKEDIPVVEEKKVKKEKTVKPEKEVTQSPVVETEILKPVAEKRVTEALEPPKDVEKEVDSTEKGGVAFDELGDVWTDPKAVKKSKKKSRRDN